MAARSTKPRKRSSSAKSTKRGKATRQARRAATPSRNGDTPAPQLDDADSEATSSGAEVNGEAVAAPRRRATAQSMAAKQRDISVSEFFAKNRHLLGFDNPRKALLTTVKEAVKDAVRQVVRDFVEEATATQTAGGTKV